jgi:vacuolar protein sorting-associated protein 13A/C
MAKRLLLNVLVNVLSDFVEGLNEENLKVGVWSGDISLHNLRIKKNSVQKLPVKLPFDIISGYVENLTIKIPWFDLESKSIVISMNGVYALLNPLDVSRMDEEEMQQRMLEIIKYKLSLVEKSIEFMALLHDNQSSNVKDEENASYLRALTAKIIENLEITVHDVHIRYEDKTSFMNQSFSIGITLKSISISTTNANWEEEYIQSSASLHGVVRHKIIKVKNIGVYFIIDDTNHLSALSELNIIDSLKLLSNLHPSTCTSYLIQPHNMVTLKLTHNKKQHAVNLTSEGNITPTINISIESSKLLFGLDKAQYHLGMNFLSIIDTELYECKLRSASFRPSVSPVISPRAWWKYAYILVVTQKYGSNYPSQKVSTYIFTFLISIVILLLLIYRKII